jgi:hypothetical protein
LVSAEIYGISLPIVELELAEYQMLSNGMRIAIDASSDREVATITF